MQNISQIQSLYTDLSPLVEKEIIISKKRLHALVYIYIIALVVFWYIMYRVFLLTISSPFVWIAFLFLQIFIASLDIFSKLRNIKKNIFFFEEINRFYGFTNRWCISEFTEILDASERMYRLLSYSKESHRLLKLILIVDNPLKSETFYNKLIEYLLIILINLRSDLQLRLEEQQKTLEQTKSEVEKNIHWTTELEQVSELQRARLDRQIEQFEELQKVLVKV